MTRTALETIAGILRDRGEPTIWQGGKLRTRGICHNGDARDTVVISPGRDNNAVIYCHKCEGNHEFLQALGLTEADLYDEPTPQQRTPRRKVATYPYCDEHGTLLFTVERWEPGKNGRVKDFLRAAPDGTYSTKGIRSVPYRLPDVIRYAQSGEVIFIVEGEKDADSLAAAHVIATCNPGGAGKWHHDYTQYLAGAGEVVVVADKDDVGRKHAAQIAASLRHAGLPHRIVEAARGKDISDHLAAGLGFGDLVPTTPPVLALVPAQAPRGDDDTDTWGDEEPAAPGPADNIDWDEPLPLEPPPAPALDTTLLRGIGAMARAVETSLQVPADLPALLGLAVASAAIGGRRTVSPKPDWVEPVTLYTMPVAAPGEMKSPRSGSWPSPCTWSRKRGARPTSTPSPRTGRTAASPRRVSLRQKPPSSRPTTRTSARRPGSTWMRPGPNSKTWASPVSSPS
jgi:putative DNA primase/helicase